ncbi:MAG: putative bacterial sensory transduction regulator [Roseibaca calidilacus]|uniref:Sensory transduction regulator n=1 Tax=Roseibaca calidilacus TaxID=1666912 RepID=A0A0P7W315_9RHOB|nr:YbjN domain-containing protein [Roseibaca calidilacus]KPP94470.1 MAG: putative bacterial sensory transduction regulator [Roseibaca calidilacus]CUX83085.1 Putative sensory transduction regulator [Roseibaca calidilacus]
MRTHFMAMTIAALALLPGTASAQILVDATDPARIAEIARGYGAVEVTTDAVGDPMLRGRMDGTQYLVFFYGCQNGRDCTNIQFRAAWQNDGSVTESTIQAWNAENRFGKAMLDAERDPVIQWDVNLFGGVSRTNLDDTFDWWRVVLQGFESRLY